MKEYYHKYYSQYLSRDMEMLVFGHAGYPVILFPTSKGRFFENKDFGLVNAASYFLETGKIKIYCPDSIDAQSWYNYSIHPADRVKTHMAYEQMILHDVIDFAKYETSHFNVGVAGCSFGAYHAFNISLRHPDKIGYCFSMSGAFDIKQFIMGYYDDNCYYNNPPDYIPGLNDVWFLDHLKWMDIVLGVGQNDICLSENKFISGLLQSKGIGHHLDIRENAGHDWQWWHQMFPDYLGRITQ